MPWPTHIVQSKMDCGFLLFLPSNGYIEIGQAMINHQSSAANLWANFVETKYRDVHSSTFMFVDNYKKYSYISFQFLNNQNYTKVLVCKNPRENHMFMDRITVEHPFGTS